MDANLIIGIIGSCVGIVGVLLSVFQFFHSQAQFINEYYQREESGEFIKARGVVYQNHEKGIGFPVHDINAAIVINFYNHWGLMVKKRHLPIWIFYSSTGITVIKMYRMLQENIDEKTKNNPFYAEYFLWLYEKLCKKYKDVI